VVFLKNFPDGSFQAMSYNLAPAMPQKRRIRPSILLAFHARAGNTVHVKDHATYVDYSINKEKEVVLVRLKVALIHICVLSAFAAWH
jgi:hypothetical protein